MIKKIKIKNKYKTIPEDFVLGLEKMTVITGKNNSGKTNFIKAVAGEAKVEKKPVKVEFLDENEKPLIPEIVYIAAENIQPTEDETKFSAKSTGLIKNLSRLFSNLERKFKLEKQSEIVEDIRNLIKKTNENLKGFNGKDEHALEITFNEEELDSSIIIQALIDDISGLENGVGRGLDDLGQGTQRIIIASILKAYVDILIERNIHIENPILILFEEPEIYLHPKLKKSLNATLGKIAGQDKHQVIITTHDPYFAYTNLKDEGSVIYSFFRDKDDKTDKKEPDVIFGIEDELLHIHLFEKVLRKARASGIINVKFSMDQDSPLDKYLKSYCNSETRDNIFPKGKVHNLALPLHIRHVIHHPLDEKNKFNDGDLEKSIKILNKILSE